MRDNNTSKPFYKNWLFWILVLALIGYLSENGESSTVEEGQNESAEVVTEDESATSEEDLALIASMSEFLQQGSWKCVEIAKGDGQPMIGATFTFMDDVIVVENYGKRHEVPYTINFVLPDWPSEGTTAAHLNIRSNKEMVARFDTDDNLIMLSWSNDTVKMKLIRDN